MKKLMCCIVPAIVLAACATEPTASTEPTGEKVYTTGSNIPRGTRRDDKVVPPEEIERMRDAARANTGAGRGN